MRHLRLIICAKLKVSVYFATSMFNFILNVVSTNLKHEMKLLDELIFNAFDLKEVNSGTLFYILTFFF